MQCAFVIFAMYLTRNCGNWNVDTHAQQPKQPNVSYPQLRELKPRRASRQHPAGEMYLTRNCGNWNPSSHSFTARAGDVSYPQLRELKLVDSLPYNHLTHMYLTRSCGNWNGWMPCATIPSQWDVSYPQLRELKRGGQGQTCLDKRCILPATAGILF